MEVATAFMYSEVRAGEAGATGEAVAIVGREVGGAGVVIGAI
jgi:hypothetical protein